MRLEGINDGSFLRSMEKTTFKCIVAALPYMWSDKTYWYRDRRDKPWEIFTPFIEAWNERQQALFEDYGIIVADESMVAWVPHTSKLGGLPNYVYEKRKPKPLGTMLRNTVECMTGILKSQDVVQLPEIQSKKTISKQLKTPSIRLEIS